MSQKIETSIAVIGIDIGKNSFHVVGLDQRGAIMLRQKWSRSQVEARFANMPRCLIGMEACVGAHHPSRRLKALGHDARLMPAKVRAALRPPVHVDRKMCSQNTFASPSFARRESEYVHRCNPVRGMKR